MQTMPSALEAAVNAARAYQATLSAPARPRATAPAPEAATPAPQALDGETLGRLAAPVVSRLIAREIRERRPLP